MRCRLLIAIIVILFSAGPAACPGRAASPSDSPHYQWPSTAEPHGTIRYQGVVNACIYMIDGAFADTTSPAETKTSTGPLRYVVYVALLPVFLLKGLASGIYHLFTDHREGIRATPGMHTVRLGYWTNATKWVARDLDVLVKAGECARIETQVAEAGSTHPGTELVRIREHNVTVYFTVDYEPLPRSTGNAP